jgi:GH24 family phage-related lysozyme (muramidase)
MNLALLATPIIQQHENTELHVYKDTEGILTIGTGFNLETANARALCEQCGADYDSLVSGELDLTEDQASFLLQQDIHDTISWLETLFPILDAYSQNRQLALVDMGFNLGEPRFKGFRQMIDAILNDNWAEAASQAQNSVWYTEVGDRGSQDVNWLAQG